MGGQRQFLKIVYSLKGLGHYIMMQYMSTDEAILFISIVDPYRLNCMRFNQNVMGGQKYGFIDSTASK